MTEHLHRREDYSTWWRFMPIIVPVVSAAVAGGVAAITFYAVANERFQANGVFHTHIEAKVEEHDDRIREVEKAVAELKSIRADVNEINQTLKEYFLRRVPR